jgi:hypothetical protein
MFDIGYLTVPILGYSDFEINFDKSLYSTKLSPISEKNAQCLMSDISDIIFRVGVNLRIFGYLVQLYNLGSLGDFKFSVQLPSTYTGVLCITRILYLLSIK